MLIDVFAGRDRRSATARGSFHFARSPRPGEQIEIDGVLLVVTRAWHRPDVHYPGPKFAILVDDRASRTEESGPVHDAVGTPA
jgi:hypothetical protein